MNAGKPEGADAHLSSSSSWRAKAWYRESTTQWDYIRYGTIPEPGSGDFDSDADVDLDDYYFFQDCVTEPNTDAGPGCVWADFDGDSKREPAGRNATEVSHCTRIGASDTAVTADQWSFVVVTTDNNDANASMTFYLNAAADGTGNSLTGTYNDSPDTTSAFTIGATLNTAPAVTISSRPSCNWVSFKRLRRARMSAGSQMLPEMLNVFMRPA